MRARLLRCGAFGYYTAAVRPRALHTGPPRRPGWPAPMPRRVNVQFYPCAAACEEAGFRPCLRCRPDASQALPVLPGTSATVSRALRLLGEPDAPEDVPALAGRLGVGERHLR